MKRMKQMKHMSAAARYMFAALIALAAAAAVAVAVASVSGSASPDVIELARTTEFG